MSKNDISKKYVVDNFSERYSFWFSKIYSFRKDIVHFGLHAEYNMKQYLYILETSLLILINYIINEIFIGDVENKLQLIESKFLNWE